MLLKNLGERYLHNITSVYWLFVKQQQKNHVFSVEIVNIPNIKEFFCLYQ